MWANEGRAALSLAPAGHGLRVASPISPFTHRTAAMGKRRQRSRRRRPDERRRPTSRIQELAAEFGVSSEQLIGMLKEVDIFVRSHLSPLKPEQVALMRARWERGRPQQNLAANDSAATGKRRLGAYPVNRNAIRRISRLLAPKGFAIRVARSLKMQFVVGRDWYVEDVERNAISHRYEK